MNHFFDLLYWLHGEMHAAQSTAQRLHGAAPGGGAVVLPADAPQPTSSRDRLRRLRGVQQHLYHCSALAERAVATVAGCLKAVEADVEAAKQQGSIGDADRRMVQAVLQRVAALMVRAWQCLGDMHSRKSDAQLCACVRLRTFSATHRVCYTRYGPLESPVYGGSRRFA